MISKEILCLSDKLPCIAHICYVRLATEGIEAMEASDFKQAVDSVYHMKLICSKKSTDWISIVSIMKRKAMKQ